MGREAACRRDQVWMRNEEVQDIPWPRWLCTAVTVTEGARNGLRDPRDPRGHGHLSSGWCGELEQECHN